MKLIFNKKLSIVSLIFITLIYFSVIFYLDYKENVFLDFYRIIDVIFILILFSTFSYVLRFLRWLHLLKRINYHLPIFKSFLSYLSGFAFTASPGKAGELIRIIYFKRLGVKEFRVFSCFIYERFFDLVVVLMLCFINIQNIDMLVFSFIFVSIIFLIILFFSKKYHIFSKINLKNTYFEYFMKVLEKVFKDIKIWINTTDIFVSIILGILSWSIISYSFVFLCDFLGIELPFYVLFSIYPLALIVGAASMIPGGFGSTEATIIFLLIHNNIPLDLSIFAAVGIRISTLWFAIILGIFSATFLEITNKKHIF